MEKETPITVIDRRGEAREEEPKQSAASERAPRPPGVPLLMQCTHCGKDISHACLVGQFPTVQPNALGGMKMGAATVTLMPLVCPWCAAPMVYQQRTA